MNPDASAEHTNLPISWRTHFKRTLQLAVPVMGARVGLLIMIVIDTAMCGHAGEADLAAYGLGSSPQIPLLLLGIGMLLGTVVMTAQAEGADESWRAGTIWRVAMMHAAFFGIIIMVISLQGERFLLAVGQSPELADLGGQVLTQFSWGLPAALMFSASVFLLESLHRPLPGVIIMIIANLVNVAFNYALIYGHWGSPEMGAAGAAAATSIARWFMLIACVGYILLCLDKRRYGFNLRTESFSSLGKRFRRIGYPMALGQGLESSSFSIITIFAGWMGTVVLAAWTIAMNMLAIVFMLSLGFTAAASVRVGNAYGRSDGIGLARAGWSAGLLCTFALGLAGLIMIVFRSEVTGLYTSDLSVVTMTIATLFVAAFVMLPDGMQAVFVGALRGASDYWSVALIQFATFWVIMLPLAYVYAVQGQRGAPALMMSVGVAAFVAMLLLIWRFQAVARLFRRTHTAMASSGADR